MDRSQAEHILTKRGWLADQPPDVQADVLKRAWLVSRAEGTALFHPGDDPGGMYGLVSGAVGIRIAYRLDEGRLVHIGRSGMWFGYGPLVRGGPRSLHFSFTLTEQSWLLNLSLADLQEIAGMSTAHLRALLAVSDYGMDAAVQTVETLAIRHTDRRIAATLLRISPQAEDLPEGTPIEVRLTQTQLGEMANADRKVVNRALSRMVERGWLDISYGRIRILDAAAIDAFTREL